MNTPAARFMSRRDWHDWLNRLSLSQAVQPHLIACATPDGAQHWLEDESHPRDVHVALATLVARRHANWHFAVATDRRLAALESAFMRMMVSDLLRQPPAYIQPADWVARAMTEELGHDLPARLVLDGDLDTLKAATAWLSGTDRAGDEPQGIGEGTS